MLNYDNAGTRRAVEQCYRTYKTLLNPIIDWEDDDVWEFIKSNNIPYCELYDHGYKRLGCVGCPMGGGENMKKELEWFPSIKNIYLGAFEKMIKKRAEKGLNTEDPFDTADHVMQWWLGDRAGMKSNNQVSLFDYEEEGGDTDG